MNWRGLIYTSLENDLSCGSIDLVRSAISSKLREVLFCRIGPRNNSFTPHKKSFEQRNAYCKEVYLFKEVVTI